MEKTVKRVSKARMLKDHLLREMQEHRIPIGGQLPTESELVRHFSVSRSTVRQVLSELAAAGLVDRQQGRGTFRTEGPRLTLQPRRALLVGVWFNWPSGPLYGPIAEGVRDELGHWGYHAVFEIGGLEAGAECRGIQSLIRKDLDGFIVAPSTDPNDEHGPLIELIRRKVPIVLVDRAVGDSRTDLVSVDHEFGAREVVGHLIGLGHRRIAFIGVGGLSPMTDRLRGYRVTMAAHRLPIDPAWEQVSTFVGVDTGRAAAMELLSLPDDRRPTAVFGGNDYIAETFAIVARERGLRIPADVSVAGFDDTNVDPSRPAWLTTYAQPKYRIGQQAAWLLMRRLTNPTDHTVSVVLQGELVRRQSAGAPPAGAAAT